ncbi:MAG: glycoside hydrolase family 172 protein [Fimbriimonas sp.]
MNEILFITGLAALAVGCSAQDLFRLSDGTQTRWYSPENPQGLPGKGGMENKGAKGRAFHELKAGQSRTLLDVDGAGTVNRMWFTLRERTPESLRGLRIDMYWDKAKKPAVSVPFGDFFGIGLGMRKPFESALFSDPEGRSFNCCVPMPFRKGARIVLTNETKTDVTMVFYDISVTHVKRHPDDVAYFHAYWNRMPKVPLGVEYEILPRVRGKGRFLGDNVGVIGNPIYAGMGFGEGEVKMYLDGDSELPSLIGTGTEDYIGTAWGFGAFSNLYQGAPVADDENSRWAFYRFHIPDPIYFERDCRVTLQDMGGDERDNVRKKLAAGAPILPVTVSRPGGWGHLLVDKTIPPIADPGFPDGWVNFFRSDDFSSTAYFYLDKPTTDLPSFPPVAARLAGLE